MALVLDTRRLDPRDRAEAVAAAMTQARVPARLTHEVDDATQIHARLDLWELGPHAALMRRTSSGIRLSRTLMQTRRTETDHIAVTVLSPGSWGFRQAGQERAARPDRWQLLVVDHATPYDFRRRQDGTTVAFSIALSALGLTPSTARETVHRIDRSPLADLVTRHLVDLGTSIDRVPDGEARALALTATSDLVRALFLTAALHPARHDVVHEALFARIYAYLRQNHLDPALTPARTARAHDISVRQLYSVWSQNAPDGMSMAAWIVDRRLHAARRMLAAPTSRGLTIAAVAHRCGFVDPAHFTRRFRSAFGCTPREWRRIHTGSEGLGAQPCAVHSSSPR